MISPLFRPEEASVLLRWLDNVDTRPVGAELIGRLKKVVAIWAYDPERVIV